MLDNFSLRSPTWTVTLAGDGDGGGGGGDGSGVSSRRGTVISSGSRPGRGPRQLVCRSRRSVRVSWRYTTSPTSSGSTQCAPRTSSAVRGSGNGDFLRANGFSRANRSRRGRLGEGGAAWAREGATAGAGAC